MTEKISTVQIRPMVMADIPAVASLEAEIFSDAWSENLYRETLESGRYDCQVLEILSGAELPAEAVADHADGVQKSTLAGYFCGQVILDEAEVHRIAVDPVLRGRGYGHLLLNDFLCRVQKAGVVTVLLEVRSGNVPAIGLYEKHGFVSIGVRKDYYQNPKEDAKILQKCF